MKNTLNPSEIAKILKISESAYGQNFVCVVSKNWSFFAIFEGFNVFLNPFNCQLSCKVI
jgi:hypothetical protein